MKLAENEDGTTITPDGELVAAIDANLFPPVAETTEVV